MLKSPKFQLSVFIPNCQLDLSNESSTLQDSLSHSDRFVNADVFAVSDSYVLLASLDFSFPLFFSCLQIDQIILVGFYKFWILVYIHVLLPCFHQSI